MNKGKAIVVFCFIDVFSFLPFIMEKNGGQEENVPYLFMPFKAISATVIKGYTIGEAVTAGCVPI